MIGDEMAEDSVTPEKRPRGRPSKGDAAKRHSLGIRTTKELKEQIEATAAEAGRSVAQEIELRLTDSFRKDALNDELAAIGFHGDETTADFLIKVSRSIALIEERTKQCWASDKLTFWAVKRAVDFTLMQLEPVSKDPIYSEAEVRFAEAIERHRNFKSARLKFLYAYPEVQALLEARQQFTTGGVTIEELKAAETQVSDQVRSIYEEYVDNETASWTELMMLQIARDKVSEPQHYKNKADRLGRLMSIVAMGRITSEFADDLLSKSLRKDDERDMIEDTVQGLEANDPVSEERQTSSEGQQ